MPTGIRSPISCRGFGNVALVFEQAAQVERGGGVPTVVRSPVGCRRLDEVAAPVEHGPKRERGCRPFARVPAQIGVFRGRRFTRPIERAASLSFESACAYRLTGSRRWHHADPPSLSHRPGCGSYLERPAQRGAGPDLRPVAAISLPARGRPRSARPAEAQGSATGGSRRDARPKNCVASTSAAGTLQTRRSRGEALRGNKECGRRGVPRRLPVELRGLLFIVAAVVSACSSLWLAGGSASAAPREKVTVTLSPKSIVADGTSTSKATATVTAGGAPVAGHTIVFSAGDPGIRFGKTTRKPGGTYVATLTSSTTPGTTAITATDTSDNSQSPLPSGQATLTQTPDPATHISLALQPSAIIANGNSFTTATATVTDAHGNPVSTDSLSFSSSDPGQSILQVSNGGNGTYSALIRSSTRLGAATITATDTTANISARSELIQTVGGSSLSLVPFPSAAVTNEPVMLIATVDGVVAPSGTVTFATARGAPLAGCGSQPVTPAHPSAVCQTTFAASTSPEQIEAMFSPNPGSPLMAANAITTVTVARDSTSTSVDAVGTIHTGSMTTYKAIVAPPAVRPGPNAPAGTVEFFDGGQPIPGCVAQTLAYGQATCTVTYKSPGRHSITASYGGDSNFLASASPAQPVSVVSAPVKIQGVIHATLQWSFAFGPTYTRVLYLIVNGASPGGTVLVNCHGRGCPFAKRAIPVTKTRRCGPKGRHTCLTHGRVDLTPALRNHRLRVGTRINVQIVRRGWVGKYYMFTVRSRQGPGIQINCLAPGGTRPGVGC